MPMYDYKCINCGEIKLDLKMSQIPLNECPLCDSENIERVYNGSVGVIYNCNGFYNKDNMKG